ncbi:MAG: oxidoreductase [Flavobacteriaceae bacterium]
MKLVSFLFILLAFVSCSKKSPTFESVEIVPVFIDSLSIRAIAPLDVNRVWFAANKGMIGLIDDKTPKLATIKYEDSLLHFRTIAATQENVFVLSIANPAVLYKIGFNGSEATHIEEVYIEKGEKVFYDAMAFWNDKEGIAIGDPTENCLSIIITRDSGNTWHKIPCSKLPITEEGEAAFAASNTNIAIYNNHTWVASGGKRARVFYSADKGVTWEVFNTPILQGKSMTGIYSIRFYNEKIGIIFGGDWENKSFNEGNKAITKDGGKTWKLLANGKGPGYRSSVAFVPNSNGKGIVAVGSPGISYSPDAGKTWKELSQEGLYSIEFVNDSIAFGSGQNRIVKLQFK